MLPHSVHSPTRTITRHGHRSRDRLAHVPAHLPVRYQEFCPVFVAINQKSCELLINSVPLMLTPHQYRCRMWRLTAPLTWAEARRSDLSQEIQDVAREQRPAKASGREVQEASLSVLAKEDGATAIGRYLNWRKSRPCAQCWWCPYRTKRREHVFKNCPRVGGTKENVVGGGAEGDWEGGGSFQNLG
jgi:hypothetical protein